VSQVIQRRDNPLARARAKSARSLSVTWQRANCALRSLALENELSLTCVLRGVVRVTRERSEGGTCPSAMDRDAAPAASGVSACGHAASSRVQAPLATMMVFTTRIMD